MLNIGFIGCVEFSQAMLTGIESHPDARVTAVVSRPRSPANSDFYSLIPWAEQHYVPYLSLETPDQYAVDAWFADHSVDVIYCLGWSFLLPETLLQRPRLGVVGFHPAALPRHRGRHPIIWALALGLRETASTFFMMDGGADSGDILNQQPVPIGPDDAAADLYARVTATALPQLRALTTQFANGTVVRIPQAHERATAWRKRTRSDGMIDWRMPATGIHNLVRALSSPYSGAECHVEGEGRKVWRTEVVQAGEFSDEPGKVLSNDVRGPVVKCGIDAIRLLDHELVTIPSPGSYIL